MKVYQGHSASPGLVMGRVSRLERWHEIFSAGPFNAERDQRLLENAVRTAQRVLDGIAAGAPLGRYGKPQRQQNGLAVKANPLTTSQCQRRTSCIRGSSCRLRA